MTKRGISLAVWLAAGLSVACSSGPSEPATPRYLYVGCGGGAIAGYAIDPATGALSALPGSPFATAIWSPYLPTSNGKDLLFSSGELAYQVERFRIGADGALSSLGTTPISLATGPSLITRDGRHLLVSGEGLHVYAVDAGGTLTEVRGSPFAGAGLAPWGAVQSHDGRIFVANSASAGGVSAFTIDEAGALSERRDQGSPFSAGGGPGFCLALSPDGTRLYEVGFGTGEVAGWAIDLWSGAVTPLPASPWTTPGGGVWMVAATGRYLYASEATGVAGYVVGGDGALTPLDGSPFTVVNAGVPFGLAADPSGKYLYLTDQTMNAIHGFTVGKDGALAEIDGSPWSTPAVPGGIAFAR